MLGRLLDPLTLERIRDGELKVPPEQDAFTTAELLDRLTKSIMGEVEATGPGDYSNRKPAIASLRRGLQRAYVSRLSGLVLGQSGGSPDAQAIAALQLRDLDARIDALLAKNDLKLDDYSRGLLTNFKSKILNEKTGKNLHKFNQNRNEYFVASTKMSSGRAKNR